MVTNGNISVKTLFWGCTGSFILVNLHQRYYTDKVNCLITTPCYHMVTNCLLVVKPHYFGVRTEFLIVNLHQRNTALIKLTVPENSVPPYGL